MASTLLEIADTGSAVLKKESKSEAHEPATKKFFGYFLSRK